MKEKSVLTKNCIEPWKSFFFSPNGNVIPCCGSPLPDGDFGNINNINLDTPDYDSLGAVFASEAYRDLRRQLLEGNIQKACAECRVVATNDISPEMLRKRVIDHLRFGGRTISESTDLTAEFAFTDCFTNVTDRCNFSCIYCYVHSNDKPGEGVRNYLEIDREHFLKVVSFLSANGLKYLNLGGTGELTIYPHWHELCLDLFRRFPEVKLSLVSNFGRRFSDADIDILLRFFQIRISCDTLDPEKYAWLRPGGRLPLLLENLENLRARFKHGSENPKLFFIITESDAILDGLTDLAKFAVKNNISLFFSNLAHIEGSVATKTNCLKKIVDIPAPQILDAWEIIHDLPKRIRAKNPPMDFFCDLGPLYNAVKSRAESITFNRFVPSENELVYKSFSADHPRNPDIYLRKFFLSFDDCLKGIFIRSGLTADINLPHVAGLLKYRPVWCKVVVDKSLHIYIGNPSTVVVGRHLSFSAVNCPRKFTHVLFEILSYEPCTEGQPLTKLLHSSVTIPLFSPLIAVAEFSDRRYEFAMAISETLKAYPGIHKYAEKIYRLGIRLLSLIKG